MNINQICMKCMTGKINEEGKCTSCGALQDAEKNGSKHLPVKTILKGKYLVGRVIGEGGFGITYIGYDLDLEIRVAIKEFCPKNSVERDVEDGLTIYPYSESAAEEFEREKEKFINEARRLAKFRNESGVVSVTDYFIENGTAYIVMDYIDGITLKNYLKTLRDTTGRNMNMAGVLNLFKPIIETLAKIHKSGIIHRDISPENIMISRDFTKVYLIDFGTARDMDNGHTLSEYYKGFYSPIEQRSSQGKGKMEQGPWTDVYALCATIYVCITGRVLSDSVSRIVEDDLIGPSKFGVAISSEMEAVLMKGLAVKPTDRIRSMEELMQALYGGQRLAEQEPQKKAEPVNVATKAPKPVVNNAVQEAVNLNASPKMVRRSTKKEDIRYLTMEQKNIIWNALQGKQSQIFYMAQSMPQKAKEKSMMDCSAATGDMLHFLAYGITLGGIAHQVNRSGRWASLSNNVYNSSVAKGLKAYRNANEVVVAGKRFISYFAEGEACKKELYMDKIVKIEVRKGRFMVTVKDEMNQYYFVTIGNMGDKMQEMVETILFYRMNAQGAEPGVMTAFEQAGQM